MESMKPSETEVEIAEALKAHWAASRAGDQEAEHAIYDEDAICDYPQSGERIDGRHNLQSPPRPSSW
jgi:hypothetical protein